MVLTESTPLFYRKKNLSESVNFQNTIKRIRNMKQNLGEKMEEKEKKFCCIMEIADNSVHLNCQQKENKRE